MQGLLCWAYREGGRGLEPAGELPSGKQHENSQVCKAQRTRALGITNAGMTHMRPLGVHIAHAGHALRFFVMSMSHITRKPRFPHGTKGCLCARAMP